MIKRITARIAGVLVATLWIVAAHGEPTADARNNDWQKLVGSWQVTSAQTSLILSVEPNREVLILWFRKGSHSMGRTSWEPAPGGILVHGVPRIRLWTGRDNRDNELRAELEVIPELGFDPNKDFHDHFFMRRIKHKDVPRQLLVRPIPGRWKKETLGEEWNKTAGRKPLPENTKDAEQAESTVPVKAAPGASSTVR